MVLEFEDRIRNWIEKQRFKWILLLFFIGITLGKGFINWLLIASTFFLFTIFRSEYNLYIPQI